MPFGLEVDATHATARLDRIGPATRQALEDVLKPLALEIASDARSRAEAHFHSLGLKPGLYLGSIYGGAAVKQDGVTAYVRSGSPLAHLMEFGFTISDIMIFAKAGGIMEFAGDLGPAFARFVHRHATGVKAYPAIYPAFEDAKSKVEDAIGAALARGAGA